MPEYLHPGVYIEETSYRGKPIEGVSTSTAGFVGRAKIGPVGTPTLVTSFTQFVREFGEPYSGPSADAGEFLGHAVRGFFDNGGKRAYIVRFLKNDAIAAQVPAPGGTTVTLTFVAPAASTSLTRGLVLKLAKGQTVPSANYVNGTPVTLKLNSLRGLFPSAVAANRISIQARQSESHAWAVLESGINITSIDAAAGTITFTPAVTATFDLTPDNCFITHATFGPWGSTPSTLNTLAFTAVDPGASGDDISILISPTDRPPVSASATSTVNVTMATVTSFYTGAFVEWTHTNGATITKGQTVVTAINTTTRVLTLGSAPTALAAGQTLSVRILEMKIDVLVSGSVAETFSNLSWNSDSSAQSYSRYFKEKINDADTGSRYVTVTDHAAATARGFVDMPTTSTGLAVSLSGGDDGTTPTAVDFIGEDNGPGDRTGVQALIDADDISMCAVPGITDESLQAALITHCELMRYRVAVLDGVSGEADTTQIEAHRNSYDSSYAAYYTPWLETLDLSSGSTLIVPPSGHVMGIWARTDTTRGVHKAPANETIRNITDIDVPFGDGEQDVLNPAGVNLIREFTGRGIRVWGARTISSDSEWKYLNVRRLFNFVEKSIDKGTQWVVFEPNNEQLWARVVSTIEAFLFGVWKTGALMGTTSKEGFFVRCDRTTMTQDDIDNGRLIVLIGLAPTKPAEFVIFRIGQWTASSSSS
ncbi:MAG TPA: phage tail sheath subtilisin-like domain-containing protein [Myxococcota bacterium]|nr:phage tail sheath subtilisin-like domain-containing protein [Myxococcota bacterium]